jgi:hypothetical protein
VHKPVFLLMLLDTLLSFAGSLVLMTVMVLYLTALSYGTSVPDPYATCVVFFISFFYPAHTGLAFTALIAIFRSV